MMRSVMTGLAILAFLGFVGGSAWAYQAVTTELTKQTSLTALLQS